MRLSTYDRLRKMNFTPFIYYLTIVNLSNNERNNLKIIMEQCFFNNRNKSQTRTKIFENSTELEGKQVIFTHW